MKLFLVGIIALLGTQSEARSLAPNTLLQLSVTSIRDLHHLPVGSRSAVLITVDQLGSSIGKKCTEETNVKLGVGRPIYMNCHSFKELKNFSGKEVSRINTLIESARRGEIQHPDPRLPRCMAMPVESRRYTADNGNIFLQAGSYPCGGSSFNTSPAAKELTAILNELRTEYSQRVSEIN